ncbi:guanylate kinase [Marinicella sp. S1101]|uniref:guanylate kinase n=1 Tax=Marinicella marina TaxID=2996016 RepID=UPI002260CD09|nr:guanylate kinase [Marinicella marina]MCX7552931.1 guanylate kinase [Marinicella marina]MDJ1139760.1 guanylate kinase [Marinicella marina]
MSNNNITGTLFIVSAPSGTGKTSLVNALVRDTNHLKLSISHTTRAARPKEIDGYNYHFISEDKFKQMDMAGVFMESAEVFGNLYGTSQDAVQKMLDEGHDVVLEIDWQGAEQIKERFHQAISIFILPPSIDALRNRLENRGQDSKQVIDTRMEKAIAELKHYHKADFLVVNDDFEEALKSLKAIVKSNRMTTAKQQVINARLIANLLA